MERKKRNPAMPLVDQILLDKLESDLYIESAMLRLALTRQEAYFQNPNTSSIEHFLMGIEKSQIVMRVTAIEDQIKSINEHYE